VLATMPVTRHRNLALASPITTASRAGKGGPQRRDGGYPNLYRRHSIAAR
jgi:hypothetical protein